LTLLQRPSSLILPKFHLGISYYLIHFKIISMQENTKEIRI